jgi:hypothetical protein
MKRKQRAKLIPGHFVPLIKATMATPAWRAMSYGARLVYVELRGRMKNNAEDNGTFYLSYRLIAKALNTKSTRSVVRWIAELEHYGFIRKTRDGFLGADGRGIAASYRLTEYRFGTNPPTKDFEKWDGTLFAYTARRRGRRKTESRVPEGHIRRVPEGHIRRGSGRASVCVPEGHIDTLAKCVPEGHISRSSQGRARPVQCRDSSSRAPGKPGDAGSNPAPEAIKVAKGE